MVGQVKTFKVQVLREPPYWVGVIDGVPGGATEARSLSSLEVEVRDLLAGLLDVDEDSLSLEGDYSKSLGESAELLTRHEAARAALEKAKRDYESAQDSVVHELRKRGFSVRDSANLVHVSHQRISQIANSK